MMQPTFKHAGKQYFDCRGCGKHYCTKIGNPPPHCGCGIGDQPSSELVGSELKKIISAWGFKPCRSCLAYAAFLDRAGADWCEANRETIIQRLRMQTKKRIWFVPPGASWTLNRMLDTAIQRARKNAHQETT